jgi:hypothetical protein
LKAVKARWPDRTILGSGDVFTAEDAVRMRRETGVDIVWIARGAIGNPWIFDHAARLMRGEPVVPPTIQEQRQALAEHFAEAMEIHGEALAARRVRKMGIKYSRFHPDAAAVKGAFVGVSTLADWTAVLDAYYRGDGAGVWPPAGAADEVGKEELRPAVGGANPGQGPAPLARLDIGLDPLPVGGLQPYELEPAPGGQPDGQRPHTAEDDRGRVLPGHARVALDRCRTVRQREG